MHPPLSQIPFILMHAVSTRGVLSGSRGSVWVLGGSVWVLGDLSRSGGFHLGGRLLSGPVNRQAVPILLQCLLVALYFNISLGPSLPLGDGIIMHHQASNLVLNFSASF